MDHIELILIISLDEFITALVIERDCGAQSRNSLAGYANARASDRLGLAPIPRWRRAHATALRWREAAAKTSPIDVRAKDG